MEVIFVLIALSVPVFYLLGLASLVSKLLGKKEQKPVQVNTEAPLRAAQLSEAQRAEIALSELEKYELKASDFVTLNGFREELSALANTGATELKVPTPPTLVQTRVDEASSQFSENEWFSEHSISLLLYVGAFLVVASAAAFVGLAWDTLGGVGRAVVLTLVCVGFFIAGFAALVNPRIKQAAYTFIAIGSLLIPFVCWGWYAFVLRGLGVSGGLVWFVASLLSTAVTIGLAARLKQRWYIYVSSLSVLSGMLSLVRMTGLSDTFYILSSVVSAYIFFVAAIVANRSKNDFFEEPFEVSAKILMPLSLIAGFLVAVDRQMLDSVEAVLVAGLGACYYLATYLTLRKPVYFSVAQILFLVVVALFGAWMDVDAEGVIVLLSVCGLAYVVQSEIFGRRGLPVEGSNSRYIGVAMVSICFVLAAVGQFDLGYQLILMGLCVGGALIAGVVERRFEYGWIIAVVSLYLWQYLLGESGYRYSEIAYGLTYALIGCALWLAGLFAIRQGKATDVLLFGSAGLHLLAGLGYSLSDERVLTFILWSVFALAMVHGWRRQRTDVVYGGVVALVLGVVPFLRLGNVEYLYYPFVFCVVGYLLYLAMIALRGLIFENPLRSSALLIVAVTPLVFGVFGDLGYGSLRGSQLNYHALLTAYAAALLFGIDAFVSKKMRHAYVSSVFVLLIYIWTLLRLEVTTVQFYSLAVGLYFLLVGYHREMLSKLDEAQNFYGLGMATIIVPTFFQMWGLGGMLYAGLMLVYGFGLLSLGISKRVQAFRTAGIVAIVLAVLSQVIDVLASLDWYLVLGIVGLSILGLAVLLSNRKNQDR